MTAITGMNLKNNYDEPCFGIPADYLCFKDKNTQEYILLTLQQPHAFTHDTDIADKFCISRYVC